MLEKDVKDKVKMLLREKGAQQFWPVQMGIGARFIDCIACYKGRTILIETKRPDISTATRLQQRILDHWSAAGAYTCLENDPSCPCLREVIRRIDEELDVVEVSLDAKAKPERNLQEEVYDCYQCGPPKKVKSE